MARRRQWSESERRQLLAAQAESGLSVWGFAAAAGVPYTTLRSWRRRSAAPVRFIPVELEPGVPADPGSGAAGGVEVVVGDAVVRVVPETDDALLARVVRVLRSC